MGRCLLVLALAACLLGVAPAPAVQAQRRPPGVLPEPPRVSAAGYVVWDPEHDLVLAGRAEQTARPMASTTKIMTALLALEAGTVDDVVTVSAAAAGLGGASVGLRAGQRVPMRSLLAAVVLRSGNDAAQALAEHVAGSEEAFVARMNARAGRLGLAGTNFVNASGLTDDPAHRASPLDLARLAHVAMGQPVFAELAGAAQLTVPELGAMESRNELLGRYPGATGVKTGFTELAGQCLVASATRGERTLYAVVLDSDDSFADATALLEHGFDAFRRVQPVRPGAPATRYRWAQAAVELGPDEALSTLVPATATATWRSRLPTVWPRPVAAGDQAGTVELIVDAQVVATTTLRALAAVPPPQTGRDPAAQVGAALQEALRGLVLAAPVERAA